MVRITRLVIIGVVLCAFSLAQAQESEPEEFFATPLVSPYTNGAYKELNKLPESVRRSGIYARYLHEFTKAAGAEGIINAEARYEAFKQSKSHLIDAAYKNSGGGNSIFSDAWTNIGPLNRGGCTKALAIHPTDPNIVYAGAAGGGVWKTTNAGSSWTALTDLVIPDLAMASLAIDQDTPTIVYAGTGDPSVAADGMGGSGLYKSTNSGSSWTHIATTTLPRTISKVLVHPTNSKIVFAANYDGAGTNGRGVYRSTNGGTTFTKVFPTTGNASGIIWDIVPGATISGKTIFYFVEGNNPGGTAGECGIYKSIDEGATWGKLTTTTLPAATSFGKAALSCPKANPSTLYCFIAEPGGDVLANDKSLYKSTDNGLTFSSVAVPHTIFNPGGTGAQGWYDLCMNVSPNSVSSDTVFIGGAEAYRSYDGGASWTSYSDYSGNTTVHVDHHAIAFDPSNSKRIYLGTDGGIYKSTNTGQTYSYINTNYHTMRFYHIGLDKADFKRSMAGSQDQGTWQTVTGQAATLKFGGDGFHAILDPQNSNLYYTEGPFGKLFRISGSVVEITGSNFESESDWDTPFIMAPKNNLTLFTGRTQVWKSTDQGSSWGSISPIFSTGVFINALAQSPSNANVLYAGYGGGSIKRTTDGGTSWNSKNPGTSSRIESFACHPRDEDWALVSVSSFSTSSARVYLTTNGGTNWTNKSGTGGTALPGAPVRAIAIDSVDPDKIWYAATDNGMYYTRDAGATWSIAGAGIGLSPCWDVQVHANKLTVRVATHGRSLWEANTSILPVELTGLQAIRTAAGTKLHWRTDTERQNSGFYVQRSYNYASFEEIKFVPGNGTSTTPHEYTAFDPKHDDGYYIYRLRQVDLDGADHLSNIVEVRYGSAGELRLDQNFPNPFVSGVANTVGSTRIRFALPDNDVVTMKFFAPTGQLVRTLIAGESMIGGEQEVYWDGTDDNGKPVASGAYFYSLELQSGQKISKKMILLTN